MGRFEFLNNFPLLQRKTDWLYIKFLKVKFFKNFDFLSDFYIISKIFKNYAKFSYSQISRNYPQWKRRYFSRIYPKGGIFLLARRHDGARRELPRVCRTRNHRRNGRKTYFRRREILLWICQFAWWFTIWNVVWSDEFPRLWKSRQIMRDARIWMLGRRILLARRNRKNRSSPDQSRENSWKKI